MKEVNRQDQPCHIIAKYKFGEVRRSQEMDFLGYAKDVSPLRLLPPEKLEEWLEEQREAENLLKVGLICS